MQTFEMKCAILSFPYFVCMFIVKHSNTAGEENAEDEKLPWLLKMLYKDHVTNEEVRRKIQAAIG